MAEDKVTKVEVVSTAGMQEQPTAEDKKVAQAQYDQMYEKAQAHAPNTPKKLDDSIGAPAAQGPNLSKEESEFAAAALQNPKADELPEEKIPAPVQASEEPIAPAGKPPKKKQ